MIRVHSLAIAALTAMLIGTGTASAQESNLAPAASTDLRAPAGWSVTPALTYGASLDDNVLVRGSGDPAVGDFVNVITPRGVVGFNGRRGQLTGTYDGAFVRYRDSGALDSYDQHASFFGRYLATPHVALFVRNTAAAVPTTELSQFVGTPFVRTGSKLDDLRGGVEAAFTKRTSMVASYDFEWVDFDTTAVPSAALFGGHSHGAALALTHQLSERFALTGSADLQHATLGLGARTFDVQNIRGGGDYKISEVTRVFADAGISRLGGTDVSEARIGPSVKLGLTRALRRAALDFVYTRSFVPSYGSAARRRTPRPRRGSPRRSAATSIPRPPSRGGATIRCCSANCRCAPLDRGHARLRRDGVGPPRSVLHRHASNHRSSGRRCRPQPDRSASDNRQTVEGSVMEDTQVHALDYLSVFRRRKWWLVAPIVASVVVGMLLARYLPKQYQANATVAVEASGVSTSLVGQSAPLDNEERLRAMSQQLLSPRRWPASRVRSTSETTTAWSAGCAHR